MYLIYEFRCDMYVHMIDNETRAIVSTNDVLKMMDNKYDSLKAFYPGFHIENVLVCIHYFLIIAIFYMSMLL